MPARWRSDFVLWTEVFAIINLAFLGLDIFLAHSENSFARRAEWLPFYFSLAAPLVLLLALVAQRWKRPELWRPLGHLIGATAVVLGLAGVIFHLDSQFFHEKTLVSLTYAAPFVAPLAYTGLGLLLIMNRMVDAASPEWAQWLLLLTLGGFFGNFILSLTDHAEDGFFRAAEWIPVVSSAFAVAFLVLPLLIRVTRRYLWVCAGVLLVQASVGLLGFVYHGLADLDGPSKNLFDNLINGAPPFAPLLFPNLTLLGVISLWALAQATKADAAPG
jgi:hypothetical protein